VSNSQRCRRPDATRKTGAAGRTHDRGDRQRQDERRSSFESGETLSKDGGYAVATATDFAAGAQKKRKRRTQPMARTQTKQVVIRMTEADYEKMKRRVEKSGKNQAEYLRQAILKKEIVNTDGMKSLIPELKRIGNNLNQIARSVNEGRPALFAEIQQMEKELGEVWRLLRQLTAGQA